MPQTRITVISSSGEEQLLLEISYELDADGFENKMVLSTEYRGKAISAVGIHYPFEDTFSDLQNKLPWVSSGRFWPTTSFDRIVSVRTVPIDSNFNSLTKKTGMQRWL